MLPRKNKHATKYPPSQHLQLVLVRQAKLNGIELRVGTARWRTRCKDHRRNKVGICFFDASALLSSSVKCRCCCSSAVLLMMRTAQWTGQACLRPGTHFAALEKESSTVDQRQPASQLQPSPSLSPSLFCISFSASSLQLRQQHSPCHPFPLVVVVVMVAHSGIH